MKDQNNDIHLMVAESYRKYRHQVYVFIHCRIHDSDDAEDLTQDTFLRLLDHLAMLRTETIRHFIFTIARNLVFDYLRRHYKKQEIDTYLFDTLPVASSDTESRIIANDLRRLEWKVVTSLSPQRRKVYELNRYHNQSTVDISVAMQLSIRTVENHLLSGRKMVRNYLKQCI